MANRFLTPGISPENDSQSNVDLRIPRRNPVGFAKERDPAPPPSLQAFTSRIGAANERKACSSDQERSSSSPDPSHFSQTPSHDNEYPQQRDVTIAICHCLRSHL